MSIFRAAIFSLIAIIALGAFQEVPVLQPISVPTDVEPFPVAFSKVVIKIPRGDVLGKIKGGLLCITRSKWRMQSGRFTANPEIFNDVFRNELIFNNYAVAGDPDALFADDSLSSARFLVAGLITEIKGNICFPRDGQNNYDRAKGRVYLKVEWQIYSTLDRRVVFETSTEGYTRLKKSQNDGFIFLFEMAFGGAVNNLLAEQGFYDLVVPSAGDYERETFPLLNVGSARASGNEGPASIANAQESVVTIRSPVGHGTGFFVSANGHIITNQHVVGDSEIVRVILANGLEIDGRVVRQERRRDIALIQIPIGGTKPLIISTETAEVGHEVFAIGSPLEEEFQGTVTSGIISSFRDIEGESYIQSDVTVHGGNSGGPLLNEDFEVIGIAALCRQATVSICTGLNFFIPIQDGLSVLNLSVD